MQHDKNRDNVLRMPGVSMTTTRFSEGPGGRQIIKGVDGRPDRIALPQNCIEDACTPEEKEILMRFTEASEMHKGNYAVMIVDGRPRGRYERFAGDHVEKSKRIDPRTYARFEVEAYKWILGQALGREEGYLSETLAQLNGERLSINFQELGAKLIDTKDPAMALGAAIGSARVAAWFLKTAYRDYYEFWRVRELAADEGRALTDSETVRRVRRGNRVRQAIDTHKPQIARAADGSKG